MPVRLRGRGRDLQGEAIRHSVFRNQTRAWPRGMWSSRPNS
jgi:hypothetical protein